MFFYISTFRELRMAEPPQKKKILKDHLDDLTEVELQTFRWFLAYTEKEGCRPIHRSQLQGATTERTVDMMVQVYGEDGAVETTLDILMRMNQNDLVVRLAQGKLFACLWKLTFLFMDHFSPSNCAVLLLF